MSQAKGTTQVKAKGECELGALGHIVQGGPSWALKTQSPGMWVTKERELMETGSKKPGEESHHTGS